MMNLQGKRIAVFDAEIKRRIVIFDYVSMRYRVFADNNIEEALVILHTYDLVVGFNTVKFDWKLLQATYPLCAELAKKHTPRNFDMLREIWLTLQLDPDNFKPATHGGYKLDDVAFDTIRMRKTGNGATAPLMYQQGHWSELVDYCLEDVRIEKTLFEFVAEHEYLVRNGRVIEIPFKEDFLPCLT